MVLGAFCLLYYLRRYLRKITFPFKKLDNDFDLYLQKLELRNLVKNFNKLHVIVVFEKSEFKITE